MVAEVRVKLGFAEVSQLTLELFANGWGRGQTRSPITIDEGEEVIAPPAPQVLQGFGDRRLQFLIAYNLLLKI